MTIKTLDGAALAQRRIAQQLSKYPADSLTPRDVILTIPITDPAKREELAQRLNSVITHHILSQAETFLKNNPPKTISNKLNFSPVTRSPETVSPDLKKAMTDGVLAAIETAFKEPVEPA